MIRTAKLLVFTVWILSAAWLIRFEAFPELFSGSTLTYRSLIEENILLRESWHKISIKGKDIGYVSTALASEDAVQDTAYRIQSKTHINLGLPVRTDDIVLETIVRLDSSYSLLALESDLQAPGIQLRNTLERLEPGRFRASTFRTDLGASSTKEISLPQSAIVFLPPGDLLPPRLRQGVRSYMRVMDPISLETSVIEVETADPDQGPAFKLARNYHWTKLNHKEMDFFCARDNSNEVVYVRGPLGITMTKCTVDEAFAAAGLDDPKAQPIDLDPEKITQYVESLVGPLSSVIPLKQKDRKDND